MIKKLFVLTISLGLVFCFVPSALANGVLDLHLKIEISNDSGATWYNYGGTEYSGGETISANPGDTITVRVKSWNAGAVDATEIKGSFSISNAQYIESFSNLNVNADGNSYFYESGYISSGGLEGTAVISTLTSGATEETAETLTVDLKLASSFPVGETVILGEGRITEAMGPVVNNWVEKIGLVEIAQAQEYIGSSFRVAVNVAAPASTPATVKLPSTGPEANESSAAEFLTQNSWLLLLAVLWSLPWKGIALYKSAQSKHLTWFIVLLLVNTLGLLEILYIFVFGKKSSSESA